MQFHDLANRGPVRSDSESLARPIRVVRTGVDCVSFRQELVRRYAPTRIHIGVCIGNFDGMHQGHAELFRALLEELETQASAEDPPAKALPVLMTFYPHPRAVLSGLSREERLQNRDFKRILSFREQVRLAAEAGFEIYFPVRFSRSFAALEPEQFVEKYVSQLLRAELVVVGYDWSFGRNRAGTAATLTGLGVAKGFTTLVIPEQTIGGERISSSQIRELLRTGNVHEAAEMLGHPYALEGVVVRGDQRGRTMGFPTANIRVHDREQLLPADGVYVCRALVDGESVPGILNLGFRPTVDGRRHLLEVHLLSQREYQLYGSELRVEFLDRVRDEMKFDDLEQLTAQIARDVQSAREYFA